MYRKIEEEFKAWKESPYRKPMLLQGAPRTGKTWSVLEFGKKEYDNVIYFNFRTDPDKERLHQLFEKTISPSVVIPALSHFARESISKGDSLLVFDEIEQCPEALTSLKYFCEESPEIHIIAIGNLLGPALCWNVYSFPVGKVNSKTLYPMDFEEFLLAKGKEDLVKQIKDCFKTDSEMDLLWHHLATDDFREYLAIGGLPEGVKLYIETDDFELVRSRQQEILCKYNEQISLYNNKPQSRKAREVYNALGTILSQKSTIFQAKLIKPSAKADSYWDAIEWLKLAGYVNAITRVSDGSQVLCASQDSKTFKLYYNDLGLFCAKNHLSLFDILNATPEFERLQNGILETYVHLHLKQNGYRPCFWTSNRTAEMDFVIEKPGQIIPIQVKSSDNPKAKNLKIYMDLYHPASAIKVSTKNFSVDHDIKTIPLYAVFCI